MSLDSAAKWLAIALTIGSFVFGAGMLKSRLDQNTQAITDLRAEVAALRSAFWRSQWRKSQELPK